MREVPKGSSRQDASIDVELLRPQGDLKSILQINLSTSASRYTNRSGSMRREHDSMKITPLTKGV